MTQVDDVSFVIIARNEEFGVEKCLSSLAALALRDCEVICVDSGSSDGTAAVMCRFRSRIHSMRIVRIAGYSNASLARNAGLRLATRPYVFFVDGDVELNAAFVVAAISRLSDGAGAVTGRLREVQYSSDFSQVLKEIPDRFRIRAEGRVYASGGCFIAARHAVQATGAFDERLVKTQDYDYTLRLSRRFKMLAITESMGTHHTIAYEDRKRFAEHLKNLHGLFFGAVLRRNIMNPAGVWWLLSRRERGIALGGVLTVLSTVAIWAGGFPGVVVAGCVFVTDMALGIRKRGDLAHRCYLHYVFPLLALVGCIYIPDRRRSSVIEEIAL